MRANKQYFLKDEHVVSLFKLIHKSNKLKLSEARRPEKVEKTDDPNYYLYHRMLGHPTKNCYIFKDVLQALIDSEVLKLCPEQKKVTANMTSFMPLQFGRDLPLAPTGLVPIPKGELRVINSDPHNKKKKGLVPVPAPRGEIMWVHPDIIESRHWTTVTNRKSRGKAITSSCNVVFLQKKPMKVLPLSPIQKRSLLSLLIKMLLQHPRHRLANST